MTDDELIKAMTDDVAENGVRYRVWLPWWVWAVVLTWGAATLPLPATLRERAFRPVAGWGAGQVRMAPADAPPPADPVRALLVVAVLSVAAAVALRAAAW